MRTRRSISSSDPVARIPPVGGAHRPVLLHEAIDSLDIQQDDIVVDATLGGAGHALAIVGKLGERGVFVGFDLDEDAIERAKKVLAPYFAPPSPKATEGHGKATKGPRMILIRGNFRDIVNELQKIGVTKITKALFDLGWSSYQLDSARGFSFLRDEPLVMTYGKQSGIVTAATIVNEWAEGSIADIIFGFGEERYSRLIARKIVERRQEKPFTTSGELAEFIKAVVPPRYRHGRIHPATRTFQALRIAVNDELGALNDGLRQAFEMLEPNGRIAVITFHSLEDRAVKQLFAGWEKEGVGKRVNKKPIVPKDEEVAQNPRSRSAKLRVFHKI